MSEIQVTTCRSVMLYKKGLVESNVEQYCNTWCSAGIKGIWNLQKSSSDSFDTYLVLAFVGETRILEINAEDELDEAEIEGFDAEQQVRITLLFAQLQAA